jgi:transposase-like protein
MKDQADHQRFIELRVQGWSFARIARELGVAKNTLINWSRQHRFEIQNLRAIELDALRDELLSTQAARARLLADRLKLVQAELTGRNLSSVSTSRLFALEAALTHQILAETGELRFTSPLKEIPDDEYHEQAQDWLP